MTRRESFVRTLIAAGIAPMIAAWTCPAEENLGLWLLRKFRNQHGYVVPGLTGMAVGQQISSRRHIRQIELNIESNVAVVKTSL
jgi:hypothetical protein